MRRLVLPTRVLYPETEARRSSLPAAERLAKLSRIRTPLAVLTVLVLGVTGLNLYLARPAVVFLRDQGPAKWIVLDEPVELVARPLTGTFGWFRTTVEVPSPPGDARLEVTALGAARVYVSGEQIYDPGGGDWQEVHSIEIGRLLQPGPVEISVAVGNLGGPVAVRARCEALGLHTDEQWEASKGEGWRPVRLASTRPLPAQAVSVPSSIRSFAKRAWLWLALVAATALLAWRGQRLALVAWIRRPRHLRFVLLGIFAALALNNCWRLPRDVGFDLPFHFDYIRFILDRAALPLASDGWQMFQMPLFYLVSAPIYAVLRSVLESPAAENTLRLLPLVCGALQILVCARALKLAFGDREDLQSLGLLFVAALPVNIYMSHHVGNEPMAALLSSLVIVTLLELIVSPQLPRRTILLLALWLSAAILTKVTAVLLLVPALAVLLWRRSRDAWVVGLIVLLAAGWPFVRNMVEFGRPFVFASSSIEWWQEPGYRVWGDLIGFGRAINRPLFASMAGFWDALYSTFWVDAQMSSIVEVDWASPWNLSFVLAGAVTALPLTAALWVGAGRGLVRRNPILLLATGTIALYMLAVLQQFLALPIWSTAKASYTLGLLPLYAILLCSGIDTMARSESARVLAGGVMLSWAVFSFAGYFVL